MRRVRPLPALAIAATAWVAACTGGEDDPPVPPQPMLEVQWVLPAAPDPFLGVDSWRVTLESDGTVFLQAEFVAGDSPVLEDVLPRQNVVITLEACAGGCGTGVVLSRGKTLPFDITGQAQTVSMWFARAGAFSVPTGAYEARRRPSVAAFPDGRVLIAGGTAAGGPQQTADLYDPATDTIGAVPPMPSPHAGAAGVLVSGTAFLVAGGEGLSGASSYAEVWIHDLATGTGAWRAVTPLRQTREEMGWAGLGNGIAVLVGGSHAGGIRDTIEVFQWDGALGSWIDAEPYVNKMMGPMVIALQGSALIAGGFLRNDNNGNQRMRNAVDLLRFDGLAWTRTPAGTLDRTRGWAEVLPNGPGRWLLAGGLTDSATNPPPPGTLTRTTTVLTLAGATTTSVPGPLLPVPAARRGNRVSLADGTVLYVGGDRGRLYETPILVDRTTVFDPDATTFAPFPASPGPTSSAFAAPLPDGTTVLVTDGGVFRWNPY